ncbi:MAG: hypothetical protein OEN23_20655 [Paracoccaceae bacterium]|nr:hypothetical protein [Paracoccaceae bacterium]
MGNLHRTIQRLSGIFDRSNARTAASLAVFLTLFWWLFPQTKSDATLLSKELFALLSAFGFWVFHEIKSRSPKLGKHDVDLLHRFLWDYEFTIKQICKEHDMISYMPPEVWRRLSEYYYLINSDRGVFLD